MHRLLDDSFMAGLAVATLRATILLLSAWVTAQGMRRASSAIRHCIWSLALLGLIAIPLVSWFGLEWRVAILPRSTPLSKSAIPTTSAAAALVIEAQSVPGETLSSRASMNGPARVSPSRTSEVATSPAAIPQIQARVVSAWSQSEAIAVVWAVGFVGMLLHTLAGLVVGEVRRRQSLVLTDEPWSSLLDAAHKVYAIRRRVEVRRGGGSPVPLTWGVVRPVVLLPEESVNWDESMGRMVLMHELAHVKRLDVAWLVLGRIATALFWFHPLTWHALRRLRDECERACDDCVVAAGERPTDYAQILLNLACSLRMPRWAVAVPMARTNLLEGRMMAMFETDRSHAPIDRRSVGTIVTLAGLAILGIAAARPGLATARGEAMMTIRTTEIPTAQEGAGRITGVARHGSDQRPVAGADVILLLPPPKGQNTYIGKLPLRKVMTDANGAFAFEGLAPGRYRVWANSAALTSRLQQINRNVDVVVSEKGDDTKPVELKLVAAPTITVRVRDKATGKPIPGATVETGWSDFPDEFRTDEKGVVLVRPLTPERYRLDIRAEDHAKESRWVNLESGADAEESFALEAGSTMEGRITDSKGKPISRVGLSIRRKTGSGQQYDYVETDADGRYRLQNLPKGVMMTVDVSKEDYSTKDADVFLSEVSSKLDITLEPMPYGGSISGIVRDQKGRPIAGAELVNQGRSSDQNRETKTGADGRFRLDNLFEGSTGKDVLVRARGQAPKRVKVEPGRRDQPTEMTIDLGPGHSIKGRVVDLKGRPIAGVTVDFANGRNPFSDGGRMHTDAQGRFSFDSLPTDCPFGFHKNGYSAIENRSLDLDSNGEVVVQMTTAGVIRGRALDARTGTPIKNFVVQITYSPERLSGEPSSALLSDLVDPGQSFQSAEGRFRLNNLVIGMPLQVTVLAEGYEKQVNERVLVQNPADADIEDLRLEPTDPANLQTIPGRLMNAEGKPVAKAEVRLIAAGPREPGSRHAFPFNWQMITSGQIARVGRVTRFLQATTDARGQFRFDRVPKNREVEIVWWGKGVVPARLDHLEAMPRQADEPVEIEITMETPSRVFGTIDRVRYPGAVRVQVAIESGEVDYAEYEMKPGESEYEIRDLVPGTYLVTLSSPYQRVPGSNGGLSSDVLATRKVTIGPDIPGRVDFKE